MAVPMSVTVTQPRYLPPAWWLARACGVDALVLLDGAQFSRRTRIGGVSMSTGQADCDLDGGAKLTIPVGSRRERICSTPVVEDGWREKHMRTLHHHYGKAPRWSALASDLESLLSPGLWAETLGILTERTVLWALARLSGLDTHPWDLQRAEVAEACSSWCKLSSITTDADHTSGGLTGSAWMLAIAKSAGATTYVAGRTAVEHYLDLEAFAAAGVAVEVSPPGPAAPIVELLANLEPARARAALLA